MLSIRSVKVAAAALVLAAMPALVSAKHSSVKLAAVNPTTPAAKTAAITRSKAVAAHKHVSKLTLASKKHTGLHAKSLKRHTLSHKKSAVSKLSHKPAATARTASKLAAHKTAHTSLTKKISSLFGK